MKLNWYFSIGLVIWLFLLSSCQTPVNLIEEVVYRSSESSLYEIELKMFTAIRTPINSEQVLVIQILNKKSRINEKIFGNWEYNDKGLVLSFSRLTDDEITDLFRQNEIDLMPVSENLSGIILKNAEDCIQIYGVSCCKSR